MSHIFRRLAMICVIVPAAIAAIASDITGRIKDDTGEVLPDATVKLLSLPDSTFVKGIQANDEGKFRLTGVKRGQYVAEVSYVGYATQGVNVKVDGKNNVALGDISLSEGTINLKDVVVTGVKTQIKVMEDTVEYNADSYKTAPNAVVEDLLKRLPGVEVDSEGKITANGKEVTKILIDGKEFFSDDPKVASKNLPVNMVDKLQVVDRKSDLARLTGVDDGEDETVINLTVKKGMQNGWFGTAEAGYGTDNRYLGSFNVNRFWNGNQITLLGNANNINELGFTDSNGGRFRRFGGDNGITTSQALGLNFNIGNEEIFRVGGDIMYSRSDRDTRQKQERQYLFPDSSSYASIGKNARDKGHNFRADFRLEWRPDSFNILEVRPRISYNKNESFSVDSTLTRAGDPLRTPVSNSFNNSQASGKSLEFGTRIIYTHNFASHRGRSFSLMANYQHSDVKQYDDSYSRNLFYLFNDSTDIYDQWTDSHEWSNTLMARASWTEPIGDVRKGNFLTFAYHIRYRWNDADKLVYDREMPPEGVIDQPALVFNDSLSNSFRNEFMTQNIRVGYKKVGRDFNFEGGLALVPSMSQSTDLINSARNIPRRNVWNYAPFLRMKLKMSKTRSLNMRYDGRSSQPSMTQLQPVADMSDPLRIVVGNPELNPSFNHWFNVRFQDFDSDKQRSIMLMGDVNLTQNAIVSRTEFNPQTGGQITYYNNVNGVWNARLMNMISMPLRNKAWQWSNHIFTNYSRTVGFNNGDRNASGSLRLFEMMAIAYRPSNLELELRPTYGLQTTHNSLRSVGNMTVHTYGAGFNAYYYTPIGVILSSDLRFSGTSGYAQGYDSEQWMWNASIAYDGILRNKSLTLTLKAYDLLQQKKNINRNVTANYIDDISYNNLTRYFMVTLTYKFNTFGKGNEPRMNQDGPFGGPGHGPGGPGGRPGGRPGGPGPR